MARFYFHPAYTHLMISCINTQIRISSGGERERGEETFLAKVHKGWRVTIYEPTRESPALKWVTV